MSSFSMANVTPHRIPNPPRVRNTVIPSVPVNEGEAAGALALRSRRLPLFMRDSSSVKAVDDLPAIPGTRLTACSG